MTIEHYRVLFNHNAWANTRVIEQIEALGRERARQAAGLDLGTGSMWETLVHLLGAEERWCARCQGDSGQPEPAAESLDAIEDVRERFSAQAAAWQAFLGRLTDADLNAVVTNTSRTTGRVYSHPLWSRLSHVLSHSTQHRAELALATSRLGYSPGEIDFLEYYEFFQ